MPKRRRFRIAHLVNVRKQSSLFKKLEIKNPNVLHVCVACR